MIAAIMSLRSGPGGASWTMRYRRAVEKLRFDRLPRVTSSPAAGYPVTEPGEAVQGQLDLLDAQDGKEED